MMMHKGRKVRLITIGSLRWLKKPRSYWAYTGTGEKVGPYFQATEDKSAEEVAQEWLNDQG